ncbi:Rrf2 family transcriptional regulator [Pseudooceanicola sediminis]|uniref:Rrf2 family transcriptional regulator n=1 Tax=Pseudooceanicola sediminis TaxID=2211117 RepID=A0A399IZQ5_9RHOB|nr:Rrf2 family transcriptional regulator [Pseudooceanicola sediminis]KAA2313647.1 Rrf2 family transcriptional regulator [Puniceibacterium sp. HSS470]RII38511.1 Rrf2 family transcriptional regulator [Pseudooceanicola sediminis]|tara:strand:+ start:41969 stop:42436 length:468 start_codon:yes stop_codon:yes gene_type:complete
MRLTKRTNIAMRVLMYCAVNGDRMVIKSEIAEACNISENHLAQVINRLARSGFLKTHRGRRGGMTLAVPAGGIRVGDVFRATEAEVPITECFADEANTCPLISACRLRGAIAVAVEAFYTALDGVTLSDLTCDNAPLAELMTPVACSRSSVASDV